jgi:hypothetical protein
MNLPLAINPLIIEHLPHAVPVVIVWGIMLRFYLAQRKAGRERASVAHSSEVPVVAGRSAARNFRVVDGGAGLSKPGGREAPAPVGRPPA